jgi:DNA-binding IscR family transcriptional regulator
MEKSETVRERALNAVNAGMCHVDSVAIFADSSEAFVRRILNELAAEGEIQKITGRAHHTYLPIEEGE